MSKIKFLILPLLCFLFACAPRTGIVTGEEPSRTYPVFLTGAETSASFKAEVIADGYKSNFILRLTKKEYGDYQIKIIGDYASVLLDGQFKDGEFTYAYLPKNLFNKIMISVFEDAVKILLVKPSSFKGYTADDEGGIVKFKSGKFINSYYFKRGISYPYALKQSKGRINKNVEFMDYRTSGDRPLPYKIVMTENKGRAVVVLSLLNVK